MRRFDSDSPSPSDRHLQRVAHILEIVERLAHPHHHDVGDAALALGRQALALGALGAEKIAEPVARDHDLADDLAGRQIAHQALRAGMAERAGQRAADLARDAERAAVAFRDIDAFDQMRPLACVFAGKLEQPFAGAVGRHLLGHDLRPVEREMLVQFVAQRSCRCSTSASKSLRAAHIEPVPDLLRAHLALALRHADAAQHLGKLRPRRADQRRLVGRDIDLERGLFERGYGGGERSCAGI